MESSSRPPMSLPREVVFVSVICLAQFLTQAGLGQAIAPLHIIGSDLRTDEPGVLSWFAAGYSLTVGTFILVSGRAGDLFGHKLMFFIGFMWFAVWSIICGLTRYTHSNVFFIICRVLQGIGPAIVLPNGLAILGRTYPPSTRKTAVFSIFGLTAPSGFNIGSVFASLLAERVNWSWAYYIMGIVCAIIALASHFIIPDDEEGHHETTSEPDQETPEKCPPSNLNAILSKLDFWASLLGVAGLVLFNIAWNQAPVVGWGEAYIITFLVVSVAIILCFVYIEMRISKYPLIPREIFNRETSLILACISVGWASYGIWLYYGWLFLELQRGLSPLVVAAEFTPTTITGAMAALVVSLFLSKVGPGYIMTAAMFAFMLSNLFFSITPVIQTYWGLSFIAISIAPFGMDMSFPAANVIISDFVPASKQGNAASLVNTILNFSISIGLGIAGTVEGQLNNGGTNQSDLLKGYRAAWRLGIGLATLGIFMAFLLTYFIQDTKGKREKETQNMPVSD